MNNILYEIKDLDMKILRLLISNKDEEKLSTINRSQMRIIAYIFNKNTDVYQKDLERDLNLRRATLSGILNTMEKNNLLYRVPSDIDSRSKKIVLNEKTKEIFSKNREKMLEVENILIRGIDSDELKSFLETINKMKDNIRKECDENVKIN